MLRARHLLAALGRLAPVATGMGCGIDIQPLWLVSHSTELGLGVSVVKQGPYGERIEPGAERLFRDPLPLDTVALRPIMVNQKGPIVPETLDLHWVLCHGVNCLSALADAPALAPCSLALGIMEGCYLGRGGALTFTMPDVPAPESGFSVAQALVSPSVALIGAPRDTGDADACAQALSTRQSLEGCLSMQRDLRIGPFWTLVDVLNDRGYEVHESDEQPDAKDPEDGDRLPRNRNPAINRFLLARGDATSTEVARGAEVRVAPSEMLTLAYVPEAADIDEGGAQQVTESIQGQWRATVELPQFDAQGLTVRLMSPAQGGRFWLYLVVRDSRGSEAFGWLAIDVSV